MRHVTVLLDEAVTALAVTPESTIIDVTLGSAGHAAEICARLGERGHFIGLDADPTAITSAAFLSGTTKAKVSLVHKNFADITEVVRSLHITSVDAILADLGWRMEQFAEGGKGLSFLADEPLLMTLGNPADYPFTAHDVVNGWAEEDIANVLFGYGEERYARRIARVIVESRKATPIASTKDLVAVIEKAVPLSYRHGRIHPATRTFQALRMVVNDELGTLERFMSSAVSVLAPGGRLAIITFHSIEDRLVKHTFKALALTGSVELITKRPIVPSREEVVKNPRARSAKLRIISKTYDEMNS